MIYTAPCVMLLMRADTLRGGVVGGLALEISSFVGPCEMARADRRVPLGAQNPDPRVFRPPGSGSGSISFLGS
jgi:hypothetical protein